MAAAATARRAAAPAPGAEPQSAGPQKTGQGPARARAPGARPQGAAGSPQRPQPPSRRPADPDRGRRRHRGPPAARLQPDGADDPRSRLDRRARRAAGRDRRVNVVTLSLSAAAGHIDQQHHRARRGEPAAEQPRRACAPARPGCATKPPRSASPRLPPTRSMARAGGSSNDVADRRPAARRRRLGLLGPALDAGHRAKDRPPLRRLPLLLLVIGCPRLLAAGGAGRPSSPPRRSASRPKSIPLPSLRGSLLDRRGNALVASEDAATIFAVPPEVNKPALAAEKLAPILGLDAAQGARAR